VHFKGSQGREIISTTQMFPGCLFPFTQACRGTTKSHRIFFIECVRTILPDTPASAPLKTWIHEAKDESKWNAFIIYWWELHNNEDDEDEDQHTESETEIPTTQEVTSLEEEHTTNMFNFNVSECTDIR
jgi:hypothetical protein